jgi:hypothetical protein
MHTRVSADQDLISPDADEFMMLRDVFNILQDVSDDTVRLEVPSGKSVMLPQSAMLAMRQVVDVLAHNKAVLITEVRRHLTLDQVAGLLKLPLTHVTRIVDNGELVVTLEHGIPSVTLADLLAFIDARARQRSNALCELTQLSQKMGFYQPSDRNRTDDS